VSVAAHACQVVTWQAPGGGTLNVCLSCEKRLHTERRWPRDARGQEYCQVSHGAHDGRCGFEGEGGEPWTE
jgi:hypothetical protein